MSVAIAIAVGIAFITRDGRLLSTVWGGRDATTRLSATTELAGEPGRNKTVTERYHDALDACTDPFQQHTHSTKPYEAHGVKLLARPLDHTHQAREAFK